MRRYSEYQQTDIGWIGEVPGHWTKNKFKFLLREKVKTQNIELPCGSISFGNVVFKDSEKLTEETRLAYQEVLSGEFLVNPLNLNYDLKSLRTALSEIDVIVSSGYIVLQSESVVDKNYLKWLLFVFDIRHMKTLGAGIRQTITFKDIGNCTTYIPSDDEQEAIANFLDRETTRIDNLIAEKQTFINLLKEKRQALISHVVTKGLDPYVKMKDSGVEWIGEVPEHWAVGKIGFFARVVNGSTPSKLRADYWDSKDVPWLSSGSVNQYHVSEASDYITELALKECSVELLPAGSVIVGMIGQGKTRGMSALTKIEATINQNLAAVIPKSGITSEFLHYLFQAAYKALRDVGRGANQAALNCDLIAQFKIPVPPLEEQESLIDYLESELSTIDGLLSEVDASIGYLNEHRTALISAAVTGKIDVRNYKEQAA